MSDAKFVQEMYHLNLKLEDIFTRWGFLRTFSPNPVPFMKTMLENNWYHYYTFTLLNEIFERMFHKTLLED